MTAITIILLALGIAVLIGGAEALVRGASRLALAMGVSPLVVGLTVVAFGTSAPELAVSVRSALGGSADLAVGNVVGSNIFNVLVILGLSAIVAPLTVHRQLVRIDMPAVIVVSFALWAMALDGTVSFFESALLFSGFVGYTLFQLWLARQTSSKELELEEQAIAREPRSLRFIAINVGLIVAGVGLLVLGAHWLVDSAVTIARALGVSELVIGLTIIAGGTSLPEVATSVMAAFRGERDIAVGNVVGSNLFNILLVLGLTGVLAPGGIPVAVEAIQFDIPVMVATAVACLPIFFTGGVISRWEGATFLGFYVAYVAYLIFVATGHPITEPFGFAMLYFAGPLVVLTLGVMVYREFKLGTAKESPSGTKT
jgi:cation:H+ antiporter